MILIPFSDRGEKPFSHPTRLVTIVGTVGMLVNRSDDLELAIPEYTPSNPKYPVSPAPKTEPNEDDELMIQLQSGDQTAFETLVDKYRAPLEGFFHKNLRDRQLAEDLTQETLLKVYNVAWDYLPLGRFRGWMYRIAKNLMIDKIRRRTNDVLILARKTRPTDEELDPLNWIAGDRLLPEEVASHQELANTVDELLLEIPEEQRLTFTLHHYSGLSLPEVAEIMESNLPTTKSRLRLAREKLSAQLNARGVHLELEQLDEN